MTVAAVGVVLACQPPQFYTSFICATTQTSLSHTFLSGGGGYTKATILVKR